MFKFIAGFIVGMLLAAAIFAGAAFVRYGGTSAAPLIDAAPSLGCPAIRPAGAHKWERFICRKT